MARIIFKGEKPNPGRDDVWAEEVRIKNVTPSKRNLIKKLTKNRPLKEEEK